MHFLNVLIKFSFTYLVTIALIDILYGSFISSLLRHLISPSQELTKHLSELVVFICEKKKKSRRQKKAQSSQVNVAVYPNSWNGYLILLIVLKHARNTEDKQGLLDHC